jgi:hypothetical protein
VKLLEDQVGLSLRLPDSEGVQKHAVEHRHVSHATSRQPKLLFESKQVMPQGVAENYRYWGDERTVFIESCKGCHITDCDGRTFVDFRLGYGNGKDFVYRMPK